MKVFLMRHGERVYPYNQQGRKIVSSLSARLTDLGRLQFQELGKRLVEEGQVIQALYTSPVLRAQESTIALASVILVPKIQVIDELREVFPNSAEGKTYDQLEQIEGDIYAHPFSKDQESLDHLVERSRAAMKIILTDSKARGYQSVGIVGHGDPLCALDWTMKHEGYPLSYTDMKKDYYPQKGQAVEYILDLNLKLKSEGRVITTEAAMQTIEGFRSSLRKEAE